MRDLVRSRWGWLLLFFGGLVLAAVVVEAFEEVLKQHVELSYFVPLLIGHGGNTGSQSNATVIRALALGHLRASDWAMVVYKVRRGLVGCAYDMHVWAGWLDPSDGCWTVAAPATAAVLLRRNPPACRPRSRRVRARPRSPPHAPTHPRLAGGRCGCHHGRPAGPADPSLLHCLARHQHTSGADRRHRAAGAPPPPPPACFRWAGLGTPRGRAVAAGTRRARRGCLHTLPPRLDPSPSPRPTPPAAPPPAADCVAVGQPAGRRAAAHLGALGLQPSRGDRPADDQLH